MTRARRRPRRRRSWTRRTARTAASTAWTREADVRVFERRTRGDRSRLPRHALVRRVARGRERQTSRWARAGRRAFRFRAPGSPLDRRQIHGRRRRDGHGLCGSRLVPNVDNPTNSSAKLFIARIENGALDSTFANAGVFTVDDNSAAAIDCDSVAAVHLTSGTVGGYYAVLSGGEGILPRSPRLCGRARFDVRRHDRRSRSAGLGQIRDLGGRHGSSDAARCDPLPGASLHQRRRADTAFGKTGAIASGMTPQKCAGFACRRQLDRELSTTDTTSIASA